MVITGMGAVTPVGLDLPTSWEAIKAGKSGVGKITRFDAGAFSVHIAAEVEGFEPERYSEKKEIKKIDLFTHYALAGTQEAWNAAKLDPTKLDLKRCGAILGVGMGGLSSIEESHHAYLESGPRRITPFLVPKMITNIAPGYVAIRYGLKGINFTITSACTSATHSIGESFRMIQNGVQDLIVCGGAESTVSPIGVGGFASMKALSTRNDDPQRASRPFDKDRDGFVLGEGAGILILESLEHATKRGAPIIAEVAGYGSSCDAFHITAPAEGGVGAISCMGDAIADAGLSPSDVGYVNAHGTSTAANDRTESTAISEVFGDYALNGLKVSSTKSMTGHLLGAAGAIEAIFATLALQDRVLPPTINLDNQDPDCPLDYVPHKAIEANVSAVMSNSFGFGGTNASVVVKRFE